ncbi:(2Fe-2S) ferredoxin domain-containing protein [Fictibacillus sp. S7]|uniref:(2Fe-2S) ferredoxin domain-containing protein n=1 Tax=Fictibacillus sp. S7 TaxID=2212476 RepID=UPI0010125AD0|nr:(2Fe-2S) ferredoxin domain-containing protein [Fictibacillus sp. S7]RXZ02175.1 cobalamin biosynthesis protein [Fictibacillus sp. S7]
MELSGVSKHVLICNGVSCSKKGAEDVTTAIREEIKNQGLLKTVHTTKTLCNGRCQDGPTVVVYPDGDWYKEMTKELGRILIDRIRTNQKLGSSLSYTYDGNQFTVNDDNK